MANILSHNLLFEAFHVLWDVGVRKHIELLGSILWHSVHVVVSVISSDSSSKVHVFLHHSYSFGVDGTQLSIFEDTSNVGLGTFLKGLESVACKSQVVVDMATDGPNESLEWSSWEQALG